MPTLTQFLNRITQRQRIRELVEAFLEASRDRNLPALRHWARRLYELTGSSRYAPAHYSGDDDD